MISFELDEFDEERYIVDMFDRGVLGFPPGGIKLKSGRHSPYYHNQRPVLSHNRSLETSGVMSQERQRDFIGNLALGYAKRFSEIKTPFRHVFGKAQSATPTIAVAAFVAGISYLWERVPEAEKQTYGAHQLIEGDYEMGDSVHLGDDNTVDGTSKFEGAKVLREVGLKPVSLTVAFDREEGARQRLEQQGFEMNAITSLSRAVPVLLEQKRIDMSQADLIAQYHAELRNVGINSTYTAV